MEMTGFRVICYVLLAFWLGLKAGDLKHDDSMYHSWIIENMNCRETGEARMILGKPEVRWDCEKQDAFWRPIPTE